MQVVQRLQPNEIMCNAQISACAARGQLPQALHLLKEMHQRNIKRSTISFNSAAEACQKSLEWKGALQILNMMMEDHIQPDVVTMSLVTSPLEVAGKTALLPPLLSSVPTLGFDPADLESQKMTAMEILVEYDILSSFVEHQFHRSEWISLKGRLQHLSSPQGAASASEKAAGRLFDNRLNGYFSLGAHFTYRACNSFFPCSAGWIDLARANARCDGAWSQEASGHGLSAWIQFRVCPTSSRTATYGYGGYGSTDGEALLPLVVQHDRSRHSERLALLSVLHHLHHQSVSLPVPSNTSKHAEVKGGVFFGEFCAIELELFIYIYIYTFPCHVSLYTIKTRWSCGKCAILALCLKYQRLFRALILR